LYLKYNQGSGQFPNYARYLYTYADSVPDPVSDTAQFWYLNSWLTYQYTHYKTKKLVDEFYNKIWNNAKHRFTSGSRNLYLYNDSLLITRAITQSYDTTTFSWINVLKDSIIFTSADKFSEQISCIWQASTSSWKNTYKYDDIYDVNNTLVSEMDYSWNDTSSTWSNILQVNYFINPAGNPDSSIVISWNPDLHVMDTTLKTHYIYNPDNLIWAEIVQDKAAGTVLWLNSTMSQYTYYPGGILLDKTFNIWDTLHRTWLAISYQKYDIANKMLENWQKYYDQSTYDFTGGVSLLYTYDANEDTLTRTSRQWNISNSKWVNSTQDLYTYESHNLLTEELTQNFTVSDSSWVNSKKSDYYYSEFNGIGEKNTSQKICFYANPMVPGNAINCPELTPGKTYFLVICSVSGKEVYRSSFQGGNAVTIPVSLSQGLYFLIVEDQDSILYKDKVIMLR
jgi:hypothetical protein